MFFAEHNNLHKNFAINSCILLENFIAFAFVYGILTKLIISEIFFPRDKTKQWISENFFISNEQNLPDITSHVFQPNLLPLFFYSDRNRNLCFQKIAEIVLSFYKIYQKK